ncbi:MAG: DUF2207 domain-containing protein [Patescibacteria group bacterium]|jgi:uncharacterized membrane protein
MRHHQKRFLIISIVVFLISLLAVFYFIKQYQYPRQVISHLFINHALAQEEADQGYIDDFQAELKINQDNSVEVTETIVYNFGDLERHGIYREIPYSYKVSGGNFTVSLKVSDVTDEEGKAVDYQVVTESGQVKIKIGNPDVLISGRQTYKISYSLNRIINFFADHDELYWNVTGNRWPVAIDRSGVLIKLPSGVLAASLNAECFTGLVGSQEKNCQVTNITNSQVGYSSFGTLLPGEGLTVVLGWPKGILTPPSMWQQMVWLVRDNPFLPLPIVVLVVMLVLWYFHGRDLGAKRSIIPVYEAPANLLPVEVGSLIDERVNLKDISSTFIHLAVRGYIKIKNLPNKDWELLKTKNFGDLVPWEKEFADEVFKNNKTSVKLSDLKNVFYQYLPKLKKEIYASLVAKNFFPDSPGRVRVVYFSTAVALFLVGLICSQIISGGFINIAALAVSAIIIAAIGQIMPHKTVQGHLMVDQIKGYELYLGVAEKSRLNFSNAPQKTPEVFERHLPYAMVLGLEKKWAKQFAKIYVEQPSWYDGNLASFNSLILINSLNSFDSYSRSMIIAAPGSAAGGGSGFSGGSSGGGFGGGGGGSW